MLTAPLNIVIETGIGAAQPHSAGMSQKRDARGSPACSLIAASGQEEPGFIENGWPGQTLVAGTEVKLLMIDPCPRCVVTTLAQGELAHDPQILRTISRSSAAASVTLAPGVIFQAVAGVYARALSSGSLRCGDGLRYE